MSTPNKYPASERQRRFADELLAGMGSSASPRPRPQITSSGHEYPSSRDASLARFHSPVVPQSLRSVIDGSPLAARLSATPQLRGASRQVPSGLADCPLPRATGGARLAASGSPQPSPEISPSIEDFLPEATPDTVSFRVRPAYYGSRAISRPADPQDDPSQEDAPQFADLAQQIMGRPRGPLEQAHQVSQQNVRDLLILPPINIPRRDRKQTPRQMRCQLMEHQKVCLTWMIRQEEDEHKKGGLLAGKPPSP